jgi:hypothetical protein
MPAFIAALLGGLISVAGTLAGRVLIGLGISVVTYSGLSISLDFAKARAVESLQSLPPQVVGMLSAMGVGQFLSIIASALSARLLLQGLTDGSIKKWVMK